MSEGKRLKRVKQQRRGFRLNVETQINSLKSLETEYSKIDSIPAEKLRLISEKLVYYQDKIDGLDNLVFDELDDDESMALEAEDSSEFREKLLHAIKTCEIALVKGTHSNQSDVESISGHSCFTGQKVGVKLPKLEIKHFNGNPIEWQEFWDGFQSSIDSNDSLAIVDKFKYLKSYLSGEALEAIDGYRVTADNYGAVVSVLKERFGSPEVAVFAHFEKLLSLPSGENTSLKLRKIYDDCERHIRSLVALGLSEDTFGQVFTPIILSKLPRSIRLQLHRDKGAESWNLATLRELMKEEIKAREMSDRYTSVAKNDTADYSQKFKSSATSQRRQTMPTQGTLVRNSTTKVQCGFCKGSHYADQCTNFETVEKRKSQLDGKCYKCLLPGHNIKHCKKQNVCYYCKQPNHHSSLCEAHFSSRVSRPFQDRKPRSFSSAKRIDDKPNNESTLVHAATQVHMQMAVIQFSDKDLEARVFFDTGSTRSYMTNALANALGVSKEETETISVAKFGERRRKTVSYKKAEVSIPTRDSNIPISVLVTDTITCPVQKYPLDMVKNPILSRIILADPPCKSVRNVDIDILIGADHYHDFVGSERISLENGIFLLDSKFGYIPTGKVENVEMASECCSVLLFRHSMETPVSNFELERMWSIADIGIKDNPYHDDDEKALQSFNDTIKMVNGRYEVTWPWKESHPELPTNYGLALGRLKSLMSRIQSNDSVLSTYHTTIQDQLKAGVIEEVTKTSNESRVHYIAHHCVIKNDRATTKLRIVYDASAKCSRQKPSLNECLLRGPVMLQDIMGMIIRFRLSKIAMICDIEKAFLQVGLQEQERDVTRFLWLRNPKQPVSDDNLIEYRFCRVPFGVISSPLLLGATVKHHLCKQDSNVAEDISNNIYVDNVLAGRNTAAEAIDFYRESKKLFYAISMNIREWYSNSPELEDALEAKDKGKDSMPKVLGIKWNLKSDSFMCPSVKLADCEVSTKRQLLKAASTIFDPCGWFAPITIRGKMIVQDIWKLKLNWDSKLPGQFLTSFQDVLKDLREIEKISIPRLLNPAIAEAEAEHELHCFCDASSRAYASVAYIRSKLPDGKVSTRLLLSKVRLTPINPISMPRLELMAVTIGTRISKFIIAQINVPIQRVILWTDSKCVLHWIGSKKVLTVFVQNRIREIRSHQNFAFRYVPTEYNPADIPSRGTTFEELTGMERWWTGPSFLVLSEIFWPENTFSELKSIPEQSSELAAVTNPANDIKGIGKVIDLKKYSSLKRLLRVTSWMMRFTEKSRKKTQVSVPELTKTEIFDAECRWIRFTQSEEFQEGKLSKNSSTRHLGLFVDKDGIIKCKGRLENSLLPLHSKYPKLLPKNNQFTDLVIRDCHERYQHAGTSQVLSQLRIDYWICHGRNQVRRELRKCRICRRFEGGPFKLPQSPPLPGFRVSRCLPFLYTGVDYFGPLIIKVPSTSEQEYRKVWICLFTCTAVRAVHLEVVTDMSTEQFLLCLRRFCAIYGNPSIIISDNAKTFKSAAELFKHNWKSAEVQSFCANEGIEWRFIPEFAPWFGGFYERLVGTVKRALRKVLGNKCLSLTQLQTIIAETASTVNSRPLIPVDNEPGELTLTPAHFLAKYGKQNVPVLDENPDDPCYSVKASTLLESWLKGQRLLDEFWKIWSNDYLAHLRERSSLCWKNRNSSELEVKVGVVVLLKENLPRSRWKVGKIEQLHFGKDGQCRHATVLLPQGKKVIRPIKLLYPLEEGSSAIGQEPPVSDSILPLTPRVQRESAKRAVSKIKSWTKALCSDDSD